MKNNIWKFYVFTAFRYFSLIIPIYFLFMLENSLSVTQSMIAVSMIAVGSLVFEVPSGIFADFFGRKTSLLTGMGFLAISSFYIAFSTTFLDFIIGFILLAFSFSLISGADLAFIYDTLKMLKREDEFKKVQGRMFAIQSISFGLGALLGGFIMLINMKLNYIANGILFVIGFIFSLSLKEPKAYEKLVKKDYFEHLLKSLKFSFTHKNVRWLILFRSIFFGAVLVSFFPLQGYMLNIGISKFHFGYYYLLFLSISALAAYFAYKIEFKIGEKGSFILIALFVILGLLGMGWVIYPLVFILMLEFVYGYSNPVVNDYMNRHIASKRRATINSIGMMGINIIVVIGTLLLGMVIDKTTYNYAFFGFGIIMLIIGLLFLPSILKN